MSCNVLYKLLQASQGLVFFWEQSQQKPEHGFSVLGRAPPSQFDIEHALCADAHFLPGHRALGDSEVPLTVQSARCPGRKCASAHSACSMSNWLGGARPSTENPCSGFCWDCSQKKTRPCDACSSLYRSRWHWPGTGCLAKRPAEGKQQARLEGSLPSQMAFLCETGDAHLGLRCLKATPRSQLENGGLLFGAPKAGN